MKTVWHGIVAISLAAVALAIVRIPKNSTTEAQPLLSQWTEGSRETGSAERDTDRSYTGTMDMLENLRRDLMRDNDDYKYKEDLTRRQQHEDREPFEDEQTEKALNDPNVAPNPNFSYRRSKNRDVIDSSQEHKADHPDRELLEEQAMPKAKYSQVQSESPLMQPESTETASTYKPNESPSIKKSKHKQHKPAPTQEGSISVPQKAPTQESSSLSIEEESQSMPLKSPAQKKLPPIEKDKSLPRTPLPFEKESTIEEMHVPLKKSTPESSSLYVKQILPTTINKIPIIQSESPSIQEESHKQEEALTLQKESILNKQETISKEKEYVSKEQKAPPIQESPSKNAESQDVQKELLNKEERSQESFPQKQKSPPIQKSQSKKQETPSKQMKLLPKYSQESPLQNQESQYGQGTQSKKQELEFAQKELLPKVERFQESFLQKQQAPRIQNSAPEKQESLYVQKEVLSKEKGSQESPSQKKASPSVQKEPQSKEIKQELEYILETAQSLQKELPTLQEAAFSKQRDTSQEPLPSKRKKTTIDSVEATETHDSKAEQEKQLNQDILHTETSRQNNNEQMETEKTTSSYSEQSQTDTTGFEVLASKNSSQEEVDVKTRRLAARYRILKMKDPTRRRNAWNYVQVEGQDGISILRESGAPIPEFQLPPNRRQYMEPEQTELSAEGSATSEVISRLNTTLAPTDTTDSIAALYDLSS